MTYLGPIRRDQDNAHSNKAVSNYARNPRTKTLTKYSNRAQNNSKQEDKAHDDETARKLIGNRAPQTASSQIEIHTAAAT